MAEPNKELEDFLFSTAVGNAVRITGTRDLMPTDAYAKGARINPVHQPPRNSSASGGTIGWTCSAVGQWVLEGTENTENPEQLDFIVRRVVG